MPIEGQKGSVLPQDLELNNVSDLLLNLFFGADILHTMQGDDDKSQ